MNALLNTFLGDFLTQRIMWLTGAWAIACALYLKLLVPFASHYVSVNPAIGLVVLTVYFAVVIKRTIKRNPSPLEA